jgi:hypothetical protein
MNASRSVGDNKIPIDPRRLRFLADSRSPPCLRAIRNCALTGAGAAYCWAQGPLGYSTGGPSGSDPFSTTPRTVQGRLAFSKVAAGRYHTCALTSAWAAFCWSSLFGGQCDGTETISTTPTACQGGLVFTTMALGVFHACGLTVDGSAYCWGRNSAGNLGDNSTTNRSSPVLVQGGLKFTALAAGKKHTCGLTAAGATYCWGAIDDRTSAPGAIINYGPVPKAVKSP